MATDPGAPPPSPFLAVLRPLQTIMRLDAPAGFATRIVVLKYVTAVYVELWLRLVEVVLTFSAFLQSWPRRFDSAVAARTRLPPSRVVHVLAVQEGFSAQWKRENHLHQVSQASSFPARGQSWAVGHSISAYLASPTPLTARPRLCSSKVVSSLMSLICLVLNICYLDDMNRALFLGGSQTLTQAWRAFVPPAIVMHLWHLSFAQPAGWLAGLRDDDIVSARTFNGIFQWSSWSFLISMFVSRAIPARATQIRRARRAGYPLEVQPTLRGRAQRREPPPSSEADPFAARRRPPHGQQSLAHASGKRSNRWRRNC